MRLDISAQQADIRAAAERIRHFVGQTAFAGYQNDELLLFA
jgi:uncharacterized protein with HEPN domain